MLHDPGRGRHGSGYASRSATGKYRTTPLRGLWQHPPYFHDGSAADLPAVVEHYDEQFGLGLTDDEKARPRRIPGVAVRQGANDGSIV